MASVSVFIIIAIYYFVLEYLHTCSCLQVCLLINRGGLQTWIGACKLLDGLLLDICRWFLLLTMRNKLQVYINILVVLVYCFYLLFLSVCNCLTMYTFGRQRSLHMSLSLEARTLSLLPSCLCSTRSSPGVMPRQDLALFLANL